MDGANVCRDGGSTRSKASDFDLAIAAHAIALGLIVVTADATFERLGIRHENWLG